MNKTKTNTQFSHTIKTAGVMLALGALILAAAGCGGGGGGGAAPAVSAATGNAGLNLTVSLPRTAAATSGDPVLVYDAKVEVVVIDGSGAGQTLAGDETAMTYDETTDKYSGSFFVTQIPAGINYVVKLTLLANRDGGQGGTVALRQVTARVARAERQAGAPLSVDHVFLGAIVPKVTDGKTALIDVDPVSTVVALAALRYATSRNTGVPLSDADVISDVNLQKIQDTIEQLIASNAINTDDFVFGGFDPFLLSNWDSVLIRALDTVLNTAGLTEVDVTSPQVVSVYPADGATDVPYKQPTFKVVFSEAMDTAIDLNDPAALAASGLEIAIQSADNPNIVIALNSGNLLSYGTFDWFCTTQTGDTLCFQLFDNQTLDAAQLLRLTPSTAFNIISFTIPTIFTDAAGNPLAPVTIPTTGSFTTSENTDDVTPPQLAAIAPADGATGVPEDGTAFSFTFSETLDTSVDLNNAALLSAAGFGFTLTGANTQSTLVIDAGNALDYGSFSWQTAASGETTLKYTLKSNAALTAATLTTLIPGETYAMSGLALPAALTDLAGNPLDTATLPVLPTFTLYSSTWYKTRNFNDGYDYGEAVDATSDGGAVIAGQIYANGQVARVAGRQGARNALRTAGRAPQRTAAVVVDYSSAFVARYNADGSLAWSNTLGGQGDDYLAAVRQTGDGGFIAAGQSNSFSQNGDNDLWVVKLNGAGNVVWENSYGGTGYEWAADIRPTSDGGSIVVGTTDSFLQSGYQQFWAVKLDASGNPVWANTFGADFEYNYAQSVALTPDGGYIIAGSHDSESSDYTLVIKIDESGNQVWSNSYGGSFQYAYLYAITATADGNFVISGEAYPLQGSNYAGWLTKIDGSGNVLWEQTYGNQTGSEYSSISGVAPLDNGGVAFVGYAYDGVTPGSNLWIGTTDAAGNIAWEQRLGGQCYDSGRGVAVLTGGGIAAAGTTGSYVSDTDAGQDAFLIKLDADGTSPLILIPETTFCRGD